MGGEASAGCRSACGAVNGQPCAHNTLWTSDTARWTNERLQARLVRQTTAGTVCMLLLFSSTNAVVHARHNPDRVSYLWPFSGYRLQKMI